MPKTRASKIDQMSTAEWQQYHQLLSNQQLMAHFADEVHRFSRCPMKPDDVLRRFSLNGDGQLDLREFQLAVTRLEIVCASAADGRHHDSQQERTLARAKELYTVFCPSQARKLDIDLFCRIMTEWSLQLMRARYQQESTPRHLSASSASPDLRTSQYANPRAPLAAPYATQSPRPAGHDSQRHDVRSSGERNSDGPTRLPLESEPVWQRIATPITQSIEKLQQIFLKMDVMSSGKVSPEELELALSHIGVFLTTREYEKLYMSLGDDVKECVYGGGRNGRGRGLGESSSGFAIKYAGFLALFQGNTRQGSRSQALPSNSRQASPPVVGVGNARLWDFLVAELDRLEPLFQQYERIQQYYLPPETFRDCLLRCGIVLSNADFAALRVRLLPFTDSGSGAIGLLPLLQALKASDHTAMKPGASTSAHQAPSAGQGSSAGRVGVSPIRLGRKMVSATAKGPPSSDNASHAAGKSNEQRNAEANRTFVKIRDETRWKSDLQFPVTANANANEVYQQHQRHQQDPFFSTGKPPAALEARVLAKLQQLKQLGQLGACSPQTIFPGDRFGRISRGQFRQSLVHLGVLARYAEVEALFWALDPQGRGYVTTNDFYDHLNTFSTTQTSAASWSQLPTISTEESGGGHRLPRSVQKVLEGMLIELPRLSAICERIDARQTGIVSPPELLAAIHEVGILASVADTQTAIDALTTGHRQQPDSIVTASGIPYRSLHVRLGELCSDLLSPKKRKKHLSTTSVLLAPHEERDAERDFLPSDQESHKTDALWNCPRRRMHQDHRAAKTSIRIADDVGSLDDVGSVKLSQHQLPRHPTALEDAQARQDRRHRLALVGVLQDLLERRSDLKTALDLHRRADARGLVTKQDLVDILLTSRLNLHFPGGSSAAQELVDELYPSQSAECGLGFLDVLHRISELLTQVTKGLSTPPPPTKNGPQDSFSTNPYQQHWQTGRRLNASTDMHNSALPVVSKTSSAGFSPNGGGIVGEAATVRRKLLRESRLKELLLEDGGHQSAAILVRHAFKGLAAREMVVPLESGEFEAMCRASDIKHVCYRLGLDLDLHEQQFVARNVDTGDTGFVSSPNLLDFFVRLAQTDVPTPCSTLHDGGGRPRRSVTFDNSRGQFYGGCVDTRPNPIVQ